MCFPSVMSWLEFRVLPGAGAAHEVSGKTGAHNLGLQIAFGLGKLVQFAFPFVYVWWRNRRLTWPGSFRRTGFGRAVIFGLVVAAGTLGLYFAWLSSTPVFAPVGKRVHDWLGEFSLASPGGYLIMAGFIAVPHSLLEEYYWRWFVFGWLTKFVSPKVAMALSSLAFMAHHVIVLSVYLQGHFWVAAVPFSLCVAGGGIAWAWLYHRSGSLLGPWISHLIVDLSLMVVGYDLLKRFW